MSANGDIGHETTAVLSKTIKSELHNVIQNVQQAAISNAKQWLQAHHLESLSGDCEQLIKNVGSFSENEISKGIDTVIQWGEEVLRKKVNELVNQAKNNFMGAINGFIEKSMHRPGRQALSPQCRAEQTQGIQAIFNRQFDDIDYNVCALISRASAGNRDTFFHHAANSGKAGTQIKPSMGLHH